MEQLDNLVIGTMGLVRPWQRFAAGAAIAGGVVYMTQPATMFDAQGNARPWNMMSFGETGSPSTAIPWWMPVVGTGALMATFI